MAEPIKKIGAALQDGWANLIAMIGVQGKDKRVSHQTFWVPMHQEECEQLYSSDDSAQKVVDEVVDDGTREWITLKDMDEDLKKKVMARHDRLQVREKFAEAWRTARLNGGAAIIPLYQNDKDPAKLATPLLPDAVTGELIGMLVLTRWELTVDQLDDDILSPNFGYPRTYNVSAQTNTQNSKLTATKIHWTRILRFDGAWLPRRLFVSNNYWHDSVLNRARAAIRDYNFAFDAANAVLGDFSVSKFKMKNLAELVAAGKENIIKQRIDIAATSKSVIRAIAIDADGEDWEEVARSMTGIPEVMTKAENRMVAASKLPHTKMLGQSPSGLGATGRSEERNYYDLVKFRQVLDVQKNLDKILKVIINDVTSNNPPPTWSWDFKPLWQLTELEEADRYAKTAAGDAVYLTGQVVDASEVAASRFGGEDSPIQLTIGRDAPAVTAETDPNAPAVAGAPATVGAGSGQDIQKQALNGAQVTALIGLLGQVAIGNLPRETAKGIMTSGFPIGPEEAEVILGSIGNGFKPADPALLVGGKSPGQPSAQSGGAVDSEDEDEGQSAMHSLVLSKDRFPTEADARQWGARNGYKTQECKDNGDEFLLEQSNSTNFDGTGFKSLELTTGVKVLVGKKKA